MALTQAGLVPVQPSSDELQDSRYRIEQDGDCTGTWLDRTELHYSGQDRTGTILDRTGLD